MDLRFRHLDLYRSPVIGTVKPDGDRIARRCAQRRESHDSVTFLVDCAVTLRIATLAIRSQISWSKYSAAHGDNRVTQDRTCPPRRARRNYSGSAAAGLSDELLRLIVAYWQPDGECTAGPLATLGHDAAAVLVND
jgi:hypothetical protein